MENNIIIKLLKNVRRFDDKEKGTDYYAGWDNCLDTIILDFKEIGLDINKKQLQTKK